MIIDETSLKKMSEFISEHEQGLEYLILNFKFHLDENENAVLQPTLFPIFTNENIPYHFIEYILNNTLSIILYDMDKSHDKQNNNLIDTVLLVLERRLNEDQLLKIDTNLYQNDVDLSNYVKAKEDNNLQKILSDTLLALQLSKKLTLLLKYHDDNLIQSVSSKEIYIEDKETKKKHLLKQNTEKDIVKKHYDSIDVEKISNEELSDLYSKIPSDNFTILKMGSANIKTILELLDLYDLLQPDYFEGSFHTFDSKPSSDKFYTHLYTAFSKNKNVPLYENTQRILLEIEREVFYQNLYELDLTYKSNKNTKKIHKLYESMRFNKLCDLQIDTEQIALKKIKDHFFHMDEMKDKIINHHYDLMEEELQGYYNGDVDEYENALSADYIGVIYGAEINGITMKEARDYQINEAIKQLTDSHELREYHEQVALMELFIKANTLTDKEEKDILDSIPTTKLVKKKRKRLTKKEIEQEFKRRKKEYIVKKQEKKTTHRSQKYIEADDVINRYNDDIMYNLDLTLKCTYESTSIFQKAEQQGNDGFEAIWDSKVEVSRLEQARSKSLSYTYKYFKQLSENRR